MTAPAARRPCSTRPPWVTPYAVRVPRSRRPEPLDDPAPADARDGGARRRPCSSSSCCSTPGAGGGRQRATCCASLARARPAAGRRRCRPGSLPALLELGTARPAAVRRAVAGAAGERGAGWPPATRRGGWLAAPDDVADAVGGAGRGPRRSAIRPVRRPSAGRGDAGRPTAPQARAAAVAAARRGPRARRRGPAGALPRRPGQAGARGGRAAARPAAGLGPRRADGRPAAAAADRRAAALRKHLEVGLPDDPDAAGVRDGLVEPPRERLEHGPSGCDQIIAGAPLSRLDRRRGGDARKVAGAARRPTTRSSCSVRSATRPPSGATSTGRAALLATTCDSRLVGLLPAGERDEQLAARLSARVAASRARARAPAGAAPWGPRLSKRRARRAGPPRSRQLAACGPRAARHSAGRPPPRHAAGRRAAHAVAGGDDAYLRTTLRDVLQYQSLHRSISEAFR